MRTLRPIAHFAALAALAVLLCAATVQAAPTGQRTALVIGNSAYAASPLKNPVNDAKAMAQVLRDTGFDVTVLTDATRKQMERAIRKLGKKLREGGVGLFYYAGHGMQVNGVNYLVPVNAEIEEEFDIKFEAVDAGRVLAVMDAAENRMNVVILDACRDNPYARSFRSSATGLAKMDAPAGSLLAYATAPGSTAMDGDGENGLYTSHLLTAIRQPGLSIEEMFKKVRAGVLADSGERQTPWESSSLVGNFFFTPAAAHAAPVPAPAPAAQADNEEMEALRRQVEELRALALQNTARPRQPQDDAEMAKLREQLAELRKMAMQNAARAEQTPKKNNGQSATGEEIAALRRQLEELKQHPAAAGQDTAEYTMALVPWLFDGRPSSKIRRRKDEYFRAILNLFRDNDIGVTHSPFEVKGLEIRKVDTKLLSEDESDSLLGGGSLSKRLLAPSVAAGVCKRLGVDALFGMSIYNPPNDGSSQWSMHLYDCKTGAALVKRPRAVTTSIGYSNQPLDSVTFRKDTDAMFRDFIANRQTPRAASSP